MVRVREPEEIGRVLQAEYGVRVAYTGDAKGESGATILVWVKRESERAEVRHRAASLCADVYRNGFYVVPIVLVGEPEA